MERLSRDPLTGRRGCRCGSWEFRSHQWPVEETRFSLWDAGVARRGRSEDIEWVNRWPTTKDAPQATVDGRIQCLACGKRYELRDGKQIG